MSEPSEAAIEVAAYKVLRSLSSPEEVHEVMRNVLRDAEARGFRRGVEQAAALAERMLPVEPTEEQYDRAEQVAAAIRKLGPADADA